MGPAKRITSSSLVVGGIIACITAFGTLWESGVDALTTDRWSGFLQMLCVFAAGGIAGVMWLERRQREAVAREERQRRLAEMQRQRRAEAD